jgi:hypothetical protein
MITSIEDAQAALQNAIADAMGDNPDVGEDDIAADMVAAVTWECDDATAVELARREIGWYPMSGRPVARELMDQFEEF